MFAEDKVLKPWIKQEMLNLIRELDKITKLLKQQPFMLFRTSASKTMVIN